MLKLITGKAGTGKTGQITNDIKSFVNEGRSGIYLLVPELFSYEAQRELCRVCGDKSSLFATVTTFTDLSLQLQSELGGGAVPYLDDGGRLLAMSLALRQLQSMGSLTYFRTTAQRCEIAEMMLSAFDEMKQSSIEPQMLREICSDCDEALAGKLSDLAEASEKYEDIISGFNLDTSDRLSLLASQIEKSSFGPDNIFYVDGFIGFTEAEFRVLHALLKRGVNMTVCLTMDKYEDTSEFFAVSVSTYSRLKAMAEELSLDFLAERQTFQHDPPEHFAYECTDMVEECEFAAVKTLELIRDEGCRYRDIAIAVRGFDSYMSILESVFEKFSIPLFTARKENVSSKPLPLFISCAYEIISSGFLPDDVIALIGTGLTGLESRRSDELCEYIYRWQLREGHYRQEKPWNSHPGGYGEKYTDATYELLSSINSSRMKIAPPLVKFADASRSAETARQHAVALYSLLDEMHVSRNMPGTDSQLWNVCMEALDQLVSTLGDYSMSSDEFSRLYILMLSKYDIGSIPDSVDSVSAGDFDRMRRRNIKHLIVLGASDERLPASKSSEGLFTDTELDLLYSKSIAFGGDPEEKLFREFSLIYNCFSLPSEKLFFCFSGRCSYLVDVPKEKIIKYTSLMPSETVLPERGSLSEKNVEALYGANLYISASKADKFFGCKYAYFCQYGLSAKPYKEASFSYPQVGTFVHFVLEHVAKDVASLGGFKSVTDDELKAMTKKYMDMYIEQELNSFAEKDERFIYLFNQVENTTYAVVLDMANELRQSEFVPVAFELKFSDTDRFAPISLGGKDSLIMSGIADRVDEWESDGRRFVRVVDYKTGKKKFTLSDIWYGMGMQMLLYLYALTKSDSESAYPAGVMYVPAKDRIVSVASPSQDEADKKRTEEKRRSGIVLDSFGVPEAWESGDDKIYEPKNSSMSLEQFELLSKHMEHKLAEMTNALRCGAIDADPYRKGSEDSSCRNCDFRGSCSFCDGKNGESVRKLSSLKSDAVWEKINEEVAEDGET